jgi:hypothetical protein
MYGLSVALTNGQISDITYLSSELLRVTGQRYIYIINEAEASFH